MAGLFSNEGDVMSNIMQRRQQANQALGSPYGKYGGIVQAGGMFADIGADAAAGGGYGAADPRMQQQKELKQIAAVVAQQFPGKTDSPDFYKALALAVQDKYPQKAQEAMQMAVEKEKQIAAGEVASLQKKKLEKEIAQMDKPKPAALSDLGKMLKEREQYEPNSFGYKAYTQRIEKEFAKEADKTPSVGARAELVAQTKYGKSFGELNQQERSTVYEEVNKKEGVSLGEGLTALAGALTKKAAEEVGKGTGQMLSPTMIQGKEDAIASLEAANKILNSEAGIYTGGLAELKKGVAKYTPLGSQATLENTEKYLAFVRTTVIPLLKEFGGNDSNEELKFLQGIVGGDITMEKETLKTVINSALTKLRRSVERGSAAKTAIEGGNLPSSEVNPPDLAPPTKSIGVGETTEINGVKIKRTK